MKNFESLKSEADRLRKSKKYEQALNVYREIWQDFHDMCNEWDGLNYAFCLKQEKKYHEALVVCREVYEKYPNFESIRCSYAWCLYYIFVAPKRILKEKTFLDNAELITQLCSQSDPSGIYSRTVLRVLDFFIEKQEKPIGLCIQWCEKIDQYELSDAPYFLKKYGEVIELPSEREQFLTIKLKLLFEIKEYEGCMEICEEVFDTFDILHGENYILFRSVAAKCYYHFGLLDKALERYKEIVEVFPAPNFIKAIADIYFKEGNLEEALKYAIDAVMCKSLPEKKLPSLRLLAAIYESKGDAEKAKMHLQQINAILRSKRRMPDEELDNWFNTYNIKHEYVDFRALATNLQILWEDEKYADKARMEGRIKAILPNGKSGFIETAEGDFFFTFNNVNGQPQRIFVGTPVTFFITESYDPKHDRNSTVATSISLL